jgi:hypothetical protein
MPMNGKKKKTQLVYKPYLKGRCASPLAAKRGWRIGAYVLMSAFVFFFLGQLMALDILWLRLVINLLMLTILAVLFYSDGAHMGEGDAAFAEIALTRQQEGKTIPQADLNRCFHPYKGFFTALVGAAPFALLCLVYAPMAKPVTYTLGALPGWLAGYEKRADIGLALAYYHQQAAFGLVDGLRLVVRLLVFPFVNIAGPDNVMGLLWVERLSPLLVMLSPMAYGLGYRQGERMRAMVHGGIAISRRRKNRQEARRKKAAQQPKQLL